MWRKGLTLLAICLGLAVATSLLLPESIDAVITRPLAMAI
jgi:hypothetical protein